MRGLCLNLPVFPFCFHCINSGCLSVPQWPEWNCKWKKKKKKKTRVYILRSATVSYSISFVLLWFDLEQNKLSHVPRSLAIPSVLSGRSVGRLRIRNMKGDKINESLYTILWRNCSKNRKFSFSFIFKGSRGCAMWPSLSLLVRIVCVYLRPYLVAVAE